MFARFAETLTGRSRHIGNRRVAFALAAYRGDRGRYPEDLGQLAPDYLDAVPADLFGAKRCAIAHRRRLSALQRCMNGVDEEGRAAGDQPPGDDMSVRMPTRHGKRREESFASHATLVAADRIQESVQVLRLRKIGPQGQARLDIFRRVSGSIIWR